MSPSFPLQSDEPPTVGLIGFGAFGQLVARHMTPHVQVLAYDNRNSLEDTAQTLGVRLTDLTTVARCRIIILAIPVQAMADVLTHIAPLLRSDALVLDVGSVKVKPTELMLRLLPPTVGIFGTHPLFGPQSAGQTTTGLKIVLCPVRGPYHRLAAFLRKTLGLRVLVCTPEKHDQDMAVTQALTHWLAQSLKTLEPFPSHLTTRSFDLMRDAMKMVEKDAPQVFETIECLNPYASSMRKHYLDLLSSLDKKLDTLTPA
ncbi:prephenate dehydrogenase [Acetobacter tropicalis]|uniref:prephenate dehydrogenase n=1 Tax=Acetobacter tropicalis TaxID=104102 RepID=UPI001FC9F017|nr:prephenate dehydrogenase [Acetobacter tropicalis]